MVKQGGKGELCLAGPQVTNRYWRNQTKSKGAFAEINNFQEMGKVYRTGDICFQNEHGLYIFCGRKDSQIKIDGFRVELGEIEYHVREFTGNSLAAVIARYGETGSVSLHLFIENFNSSWDDLKKLLHRRLPSYMIPKTFQSLEKIPLNRNGKIDRKALEASIINDQKTGP